MCALIEWQYRAALNLFTCNSGEGAITPDDLYTRSIALAGLPEFINEIGGDPERLFEQAGLDINRTSSKEHFISWSRACTLLEIAAKELGEPSFGIKWAHDVPRDFLNSGPMLFLATTVSTVREFFDLGNNYQKIHTNGIVYSYHEDPENGLVEGRFNLHPATPPCRQYVEHIMASMVLTEQYHLGKTQYQSFEFQHSAPQDMSWHDKTLPCPVSFNADVTRGFVGLEVLDQKVGGQLKVLKPLLKFYLNRKIKHNTLDHKSIQNMVQDLLPEIMGVGDSSIIRMADVMKMSVKKLQRLLKQEGVTYSQILDNVRQSMAARYLAESDMPVGHIGLLLDYQSGEAFNAACQRWTGMSPLKYRKHLREQA